ncbi:DUF5808 domain-containing protein [Flavobacterium sp.]|uniref:DUF5808 domain-containing protein n=1 Tax=Flavobacterium sp. TaxID=239 RepID=UPI0038D21C59
MEKPSKETKENWLKDDKYWIWGMFYFNPEDKRIFPPKRIPWMGWTVNFANPISIITLVIITFGIVAVSYYLQNN